MKIWLIALLLLLVSCSQITTTEETVEEVEEIEEEAEENLTEETLEDVIAAKEPIKCEDDDGNDPYTFGRLIVHYDEVNRDGLEDECPGLGYLIENYCEGNIPKTQTYKCEGECVSGVCLRNETQSE